jgi:hypothetical protein
MKSSISWDMTPCSPLEVKVKRELFKDEIARGYYYQGGATAHLDRVSVALLRDVLGERMMSEYIWPPRSPNFTAFLIIWGQKWKAQFTKKVITLLLK